MPNNESRDTEESGTGYPDFGLPATVSAAINGTARVGIRFRSMARIAKKRCGMCQKGFNWGGRMVFESPLYINLIILMIFLLPPWRVQPTPSILYSAIKLIVFVPLWVVLPGVGLFAILDEAGLDLSWAMAKPGSFWDLFKVDLTGPILFNVYLLYGIVETVKEIWTARSV